MTYSYKHQVAPAHTHRNAALQDRIVYEQPLNERIRTFLRLEFLFKQARAHTYKHTVWDSRAALSAIFDLVSLFGRADIKTEIIKELERHTGFLERLAANPEVNSSKLEEVLNELDLLIDRLHVLQTSELDLRGNEFLTSIRQRSAIAGGCCDFDLPAYHFWLSQPEEKRILDLQSWLEPFDTIHRSLTLILRLIRDSAHQTQEIAQGGFYQKSADTNAVCQLVRVITDGDSPYFPEISGGKHRFTIRFMAPALKERAAQVTEDVSFTLSCCLL